MFHSVCSRIWTMSGQLRWITLLNHSFCVYKAYWWCAKPLKLMIITRSGRAEINTCSCYSGSFEEATPLLYPNTTCGTNCVLCLWVDCIKGMPDVSSQAISLQILSSQAYGKKKFAADKFVLGCYIERFEHAFGKFWLLSKLRNCFQIPRACSDNLTTTLESFDNHPLTDQEMFKHYCNMWLLTCKRFFGSSVVLRGLCTVYNIIPLYVNTYIKNSQCHNINL